MAEFTITFEKDSKLFDVTVTGIWTYEDAVRYHGAIVDAARRTSQFDMIVDVRTDGVLPGDAATEVEASLASLSKLGLRRAAHVTTSALGTLQIRRIGSSHAELGFFPTRDDALQWLTQGQSA